MNLLLRSCACLALLPLSSLSVACARAPRSAADSQDSDRARAVEELDDAASVLRDIVQTHEIPSAQGDRAHCVVVVPSMVSGGLVLGACHGRGVVTCRASGGWSGPVFITVAGGSAGLQVGVESSDLVMLVTTERGMAQLFRSSFQLGVDASAAAGPTGRAAQAGTDAKMTAEILSYAHTRGLFAGVELSGAVMRQDQPLGTALYGRSVDVRAVLTGNVPPPPEASAFLQEVGATFPRYGDPTHPVASAP